MDIVEYQNELIKAFELVDGVSIIKGLNLIRDTWRNGNIIYLIGNGGSSSIASHFTNDLVKTADKIPGVRAFCLSDNTPLLTAIANDYHYSYIFSQQLDYYAKPNDLLISFSGSGKSKNIINAVSFAVKNGMDSLAFTGYDGGAVKRISNYNIHVPSDDMFLVEIIFSMLTHFITYKLKYDESIY